MDEFLRKEEALLLSNLTSALKARDEEKALAALAKFKESIDKYGLQPLT